jgi:hypothetical protein
MSTRGTHDLANTDIAESNDRGKQSLFIKVQHAAPRSDVQHRIEFLGRDGRAFARACWAKQS